ncbi:ComEA family DNA-binding protein [Rothia sp. LK2588]|uniref:helix-hairpin-helix domain-containing protein n=1 Tax=Rothia sp. LK2588 TaxID=3114369 RepID=UPI0034CE1668
MHVSFEKESIDPALQALRRRRRDISATVLVPQLDDEAITEPIDTQVSSHPSGDSEFERSTHQLRAAGQPLDDPAEKISEHRTYRWKMPTKLMGVLSALLLLSIGWMLLNPRSAPITEVDATGNPATPVVTEPDRHAEESTSPQNRSAEQAPSRQASATSAIDKKEVWVHVAGSVVKPGVYQLPSDARVSQAIEKAGGAARSADLNKINLASGIVDGSQIYIPAQGEQALSDSASSATEPAGVAQSSSPTESATVNINTASSEQLQQLPRVGPKLAQKIIDHRTKNGPFTSLEDLDDVPGIGEAMMSSLEPLVAFS